MPSVTGIDRDERSIELATSHPGAGDIEYVLGDFLSAPFEPGSLGMITSIASLHHMDSRVALRRMSDLLRPGGVLAVVGLARGVSPAGLARIAPAVLGTQFHRAVQARPRRRGGSPSAGTYQSPVIWPPPLTYGDMRRLATGVLPGARYRRHLYWRYSLVWTKPTP